MIRLLSFVYLSLKPVPISKMPMDATLDPRENGFKPALLLTLMSDLMSAWTP